VEKEQDPGGVFDDDNIGRDKWELTESTKLNDAYTGEEKIKAVYIQADNEIGSDWRLMLGVRWEESEQSFDGYNARNIPTVFSLSEDYFLPAATLTWAFRPDMQIRAAYSQTINRPDLREISPVKYFDPEDRIEKLGNENLQIAELTNYDLSWEWYYGGLDNLQVAIFYKDLEQPIEETLLRVGTADTLITYQNAEQGTLYGLEFSIRQGLEFVSDWTRDFYFKFNGALIDSEVETDTTTSPTTNAKRELQGQSPWVVNYQLTYDDQPRDLQATIVFNMFGERIDNLGISGLGDAKEQPRPILDFIYNQGFTVFGEEFKLKLKFKNLLDADYEVTRNGYTERKTNFGRTFSIGFEKDF
jgi:TonB-dependent receptor